MTVEKMLKEHNLIPTDWDKWNYEVYGPLSISDEALVRIVFIWRDGKERSVTLYCH
jgi:hypothetical protein